MKTKEYQNSYNIYDKQHEGTILYRAVASSEEEVRRLAEESGIDLNGLMIEMERKNVKDEMGRDYTPYIEDSLIY